MYDPYENRRARRAQRRYERDMRRAYRYQNPMRGLASGLFILAIIIGFAFNDTWDGKGFLPLLFVGLAFLSLFGASSTMSRNGIYGGLHGFIWMLGLALCFIIGFWPWILLPIAVSAILGSLYNPIMGGLTGAGFMGASQMRQQPPNYQPQPPSYQEQQQPEQPAYQPYQQGYQGASPQPTYQEGGQQYPYSQEPRPHQQYEQPQVQYPEQQQELPPMEQH